jgi:leucyl-tRNA synthetase
MNERIAELWDKAAEDTMDQSWESQTKFMERFAELIAEECMNIIVQNRKYASQHKWPAVELANVCLYEIDKTFGVQEDGKETVSS